MEYVERSQRSDTVYDKRMLRKLKAKTATKALNPSRISLFSLAVASLSASDFVIFGVGGPLQSPFFVIMKRRMT